MLPESASQDYTIDEIQDVINIVRACVDRKAVSYPPDRDKTFSFAAQYQLNTNLLNKILLHLTVEDFCYTLVSRNTYKNGTLLYVFSPTENLTNLHGKKVSVELYIKLDVMGKCKDKTTVVVSMHELEFPIEHAFR